ncbi:katanin p60 ATPase-containing subunit A-like 2 isoform X2 [Crassostrea angulata]|uniref:katanin p60 ATPase-containing subunit A-like 2 isoform X2 n=1 Tax=Magallana angulata TaxID=2784310 RepID=UPI0022B0A9D4|nr:katanin p60 ATPase-containing subunit A-like 2 isoform X2 [Crassostrea angulata]
MNPMSELSYQAIRTANQAREADELRTDTRKKNLLILVLNYMHEEGYVDSAQSLARETNIDLSKYEVCDNIDLETILMEYESYYYVKFSKYPKITKKLGPQSAGDRRGGSHKVATRTNSLTRRVKSGSQSAHQLNGKNSASTTPSLPRIPQNGRASPPPPVSGGRPKSGVQPGGRQARATQSSTRRPNGLPEKNEKMLCRVVVSDNEIKSYRDMMKMNGVTNGSDPGLALQGLTVQGSNNNNNPDNRPVEDPAQRRGKPGQIIDIRSMINEATKLNAEEGMDGQDRLLKPLGGYVGYNSEWRELAQVISRDIYSENPNVKWDDIIGLEEAKRLSKEAVVYPIKYPQLFKGILSPWKGLLLYGPPGTGKTLLAKAIATECQTTFFNISASSIVSKWRGDSEKLVRVLFEMARFYAPSTIFLDELEAIMSQRGSQGGSGEHEGSRRMKTELLVQMDGLSKTDDLVFLLAASNLPWELDQAMLRRLEKRIIVDLPTYEARKAMFKHHLPTVVVPKEGGLELLSNLDYDLLATKTEGYSGSDLRLVCKEAAMRPVRKIFDALEKNDHGDLHIRLDTITTSDVMKAIDRTKPSAGRMKERYAAWQREYESV